jgi:cell fate (sporulation/competence/biofilm development) regulator YlbF (YheA/YmcA/DUF963 family)
MKQDTKEETGTSVDPAVFHAARNLAGAVGISEPFLEFEAALNAFQSDEKARELLANYRKAENKLRSGWSWGGITEDEQERFSLLEKEMFADPVIKRYFASQESLVKELKDLNVYITGKLGFDFADLTKPAGGCC